MADLFAGIGGFHLAFDRVGARTVFAAENDPHARRTYEANFRPKNPELFETGNFAGDVTTLDPQAMPDFDVLTAGFPCQPFSITGKRQGFDDARGTMFFEIARILAAKQPAAFFLENVQGLTSHDGGRTLATITDILQRDLGYSFHKKIIRACDFGLPQLRPRLFMVGFRDPATPFTWPEPAPLRFTLSELLGGRVNREIAYTVLASGRYKPFGTSRAWDAYLVDGKLHRLTIDEVRALQGFPEDFVFPVAMTHAYAQLGNAVAVPAVEAVARQLVGSLTSRPEPHRQQPPDSAEEAESLSMCQQRLPAHHYRRVTSVRCASHRSARARSHPFQRPTRRVTPRTATAPADPGASQ